MDLLIPYSWIKEYLKTNATAEKFAECLTLCGPTVDSVKKVNDDHIFQLDITHNRVDAASVSGIAQEAAAILPRFKIKAKKVDPTPKPRKYQVKKAHPYLSVRITPPSLCTRFTTILLKDVKIKPSPLWLKDRLGKSGMRPLNNVVDISNYIMRETGQPLHTFDYDKIKGHKMLMRESKKGEKIITLDGQERTLPGGDIVIEDQDKNLIDLCGIMGGKLSEVDENTKNVLLFVQTYEPLHIRKTSLSLNHRTEAAVLFEKTLDPEKVLPTLKRATDLFMELAGAKTDLRVIDIYLNPAKEKRILFNLSNIKRLIGVEIKTKEVTKILNSLGFKTKNGKKGIVTVTVPSARRTDVNNEEDIIEEIARLYGYFNLPNVVPLNDFPLEENDKELIWERKIKEFLRGLGLTEVTTYSLVSNNLLKLFNENSENYMKLANPMSDDAVYLRQSLIPSLLKVVSQNQAGGKTIKIFEVAKTYFPPKNDLKKVTPDEPLFLTVVQGPTDFYITKGVLESVIKQANLKADFFPIQESKNLDPRKSAQVQIADTVLGTIGEIKNEILKAFGIEEPVCAFEVNLSALANKASPTKNINPPPKFPPLIEDFTFKTEGASSYADIVNTLKQTSSLISQTRLLGKFQEYRTIRVTYQSPERSLTENDASMIRTKIIGILKEKYHSQVKEKA